VRRCSESVAQLLFLEKAVYILPSLSFLSTPSLPSREQLLRTWARVVTICVWAAALTVTAARLSRKLWELVRPGLARLLHALALLLDGGLAYPDQPEPDPTPDPQIEFLQEVGAIGIRESRTTCSNQLAAVPNSAATKPRPARRSRAKAAPKEAA
jgi:hypothetical protein